MLVVGLWLLLLPLLLSTTAISAFSTALPPRRAVVGTSEDAWRLFGGSSSTENDKKNDQIYDVAIIGSGPASCSLAALLTSSSSRERPNVVVVSKNADKRWIPNYGCWTEEWTTLDELYRERGVPGLMEEGVDVHWSDTDCFFGEIDDGVVKAAEEGNYRRVLGREYLRVSREGLKYIFYGENRNYDVIKDDVQGKAVSPNLFMPAQSITFHDGYTELTLMGQQKIRAKIVVDGTGAESPFTIRDGRDREGYQIAYGAECKVTGEGVTSTHVGDYDRTKMTLFDFRSQAWRGDDNNNSGSSSDSDSVVQEPTFNYVMPLSQDVVFFEETSLVANPAMSFRECQERLTKRLQSQGVTITEILEEELCYIPMGGQLPRKGQRIVPIGAAAGLVHPSTGYQLGRALSSNLDVSDQILKELSNHQKARDTTSFDPDAAAARIIDRMWTPEAIRQRNFAVFGGEYFMTLNGCQLKSFFAGFFRLDPSMWGGFLAGWKNLPGYNDHNTWWARLSFGLAALSKLELPAALSMAGGIMQYVLFDENGTDLIQSVTPFAGMPDTYESRMEFRRNQGDLAAKKEAMEMLCACDLCEGEAEMAAKSAARETGSSNEVREKVTV